MLQQAVDFLHRGAAAFGDAAAALAVDDHVVALLGVRHGIDDGDSAADLLRIHLGFLQRFDGAHVGQHAEDGIEAAEFG